MSFRVIRAALDIDFRIDRARIPLLVLVTTRTCLEQPAGLSSDSAQDHVETLYIAISHHS